MYHFFSSLTFSNIPLCFLDLFIMLKKNLIIPDYQNVKIVKFLFRLTIILSALTRKIPFFCLLLFQSPEWLSRPLQHADDELRGPVSPSSRFREILISAYNHFFLPKPEMYHFFVFDFFNHLKGFSRPLHHAAKKKFRALDDHHLVKRVKISLFLGLKSLFEQVIRKRKTCDRL